MRNLGLDILRLAAVILTLGRHLHLPPGKNPILGAWQTGGWVGVDMFFVLSGFLVSGLLFKEFLRERRVDLKRFLIRRACKIYPAFYCLIAVTVAVQIWTHRPIGLRSLLGEVLFLQN